VIGDILQPTHLLLILAVALLVLGPKRLPEAGKALGKGLRDFRSAVAGLTDDVRVEVPPAQAAPPAPSQGPQSFSEPAIAAEPVTTVLTSDSFAAAPSFDEPVIPEAVVPHAVVPDSAIEEPAPTREFVSPGIGTASRAARAEVEAAEPAEYAD
jgi:sec-independent protein translocase protein TatA